MSAAWRDGAAAGFWAMLGVEACFMVFAMFGSMFLIPSGLIRPIGFGVIRGLKDPILLAAGIGVATVVYLRRRSV